MAAGLLYLMYHELEVPGREILDSGAGYCRYVLLQREFREQLAWLRSSGFAALTVGRALNAGNTQEKAVVITFDDGAATDLLVAAPLLREFGFSATFYLTSGFLGKHGYLNAAQVRQLAAEGFEIGCHSRTHRYLNDLDERLLEEEIIRPKHELEEIIRAPIEHFSCPGGRWSRELVEIARRAGYKSVATSRIVRNSADANPYRLGRVAILRGTAMESFAQLCNGKGLLARQFRSSVLSGAKGILGNSLYGKLRSAALAKED